MLELTLTNTRCIYVSGIPTCLWSWLYF